MAGEQGLTQLERIEQKLRLIPYFIGVGLITESALFYFIPPIWPYLAFALGAGVLGFAFLFQMIGKKNSVSFTLKIIVIVVLQSIANELFISHTRSMGNLWEFLVLYGITEFTLACLFRAKLLVTAKARIESGLYSR